MTPTQITTGPGVNVPGPAAAAFVVALTVLAAGAPLGIWAPHGTARHLAARLRARRDRNRADRALLRLARERCGNPTCPTCHALAEIAQEANMQPDPVAHALARLAADDPQRSPDWCWTHGCHRSQCPAPEQGGH